MVEVAERSRPAVVDGDEPSEQMGHERHLPDEYPQLVHNTGKFGDKVVAVSSKFVDKAVVAPWPPDVHFVLPEGAGTNRQTGQGSDPRGGPGNQVREP
jgi:hypothetical protein